MGNREVLRALLWAAMAFFAWQLIAVQIWPPPAENLQPLTTNQRGPDGEAFDPDRQAPDGTVSPPTFTSPTPPTMTAGGDTVTVVGGTQETLLIGDDASGRANEYGLTIVLSSLGASVAEATLSDFTLSVEKDSPPYPVLQTVVGDDGRTQYSYATENIHLGAYQRDLALDQIHWSVEERSVNRVVFFVDINAGQTPILRIRKTFTLPSESRVPARHDLTVTLEVENRSDRIQPVILTQRGPVGLRREDPRYDDRSVFVGTRDEDGIAVDYALCSSIKEESQVFSADFAQQQPLMWTALGNKYFVAFDSPRPLPGQAEVDWIREIVELPISHDPANGTIVTFRTTTTPFDVPQDRRIARVFDYYLGPKSRDAFNEVPDYIARKYDEQVLAGYSVGACAIMTFKPLTVFMIWLLNHLESVVRNYGIAIIILVLFVRTLLHPITKKGQVNMMRMQQQMGTLQPKIEEIKKRFANDKNKLNQEVMKLYKETGVNPATGMLSSCLPMFLQMPIWIALYTSLNFNIDMRHQPFFWWINDLTAPDAMITFDRSFNIPLLSAMMGPISSFNLLPILVSASMFLQQKLMPKPKPTGQSAEQQAQSQQMQKMMPYMTLFFGLLFYNMPSGLNLYIMASSGFGSLEQWRIRKHIEELKNQPAPVEKAPAPATTTKRRKPSLFERLQKAAKEAEKVKSANPHKRRK